MSASDIQDLHQIAKPPLYALLGKRLLDVVLVLVAAPAIVPIVLLLAIGVGLDLRNPFYCQKRIGRNGQEFTLWKLRSMVHKADEKLDAYLDANPEARSEWDEKQKLANDPRITRFGHFIRKTSLDELPQFWNVLIGNMSLVGPRPMMVSQKDQYPGQDYYALRPGITGSWQVSARNESSFAERAQFDSSYRRDLSLKTDLKLLSATVRVVLRATGT